MNIRPNTVIVSLAALWILMGLFGGLIYLAGPTHQDAQPLKAYSTPPWVHAGRVSAAAGVSAAAPGG